MRLPGGHALPRARAGRARAQGRVRRPARGARGSGLRAGADRRRRPSSSPTRERASSPATSSTRSRSSSTGSSAATGSSAGSPIRSRPRCGSREGVAEIEIVGGGSAAKPTGKAARSEASQLKLGDSAADDGGDSEILTFSQHLACTHCGLSFEELAPRSFSFNSPYGACPACDGLGTKFEVDPELVVPDDGPVDRHGRDRAVVGLPWRVLQPGARPPSRASTTSRPRRRGRS